MMASAPTLSACFAYLIALATFGPCTPITIAGRNFFPVEAMASLPSRRSASLRVIHSLAICGQTNPCTPPRSMNRTSSTRASRSSLFDSVNGVCAIGKIPRNGFEPGLFGSKHLPAMHRQAKRTYSQELAEMPACPSLRAVSSSPLVCSPSSSVRMAASYTFRLQNCNTLLSRQEQALRRRRLRRGSPLSLLLESQLASREGGRKRTIFASRQLSPSLTSESLGL